MPQPSQLLIFDFDGTLADSEQALIAAYGRMRTEYNLPELSHEEFQELKHLTMIERLKFAHEHGVRTHMIPGIMFRLLQEMRHDIEAVVLFPGIPEVMRELQKRGHQLAIVSSSTKDIITDILTRFELNIFASVLSGSSLFGKARKLTRVMRQLEVAPAHAIYIGDEVRDIEAAQKVGIRSVACTWGLDSGNNLRAQSPDFLIGKPAELLQLM